MDLVTLVFIVLFLAIIAVLIRFLFFTGKHKASSHDLEIKALNYMLKGEKEQALKLLKEIGHQDTSNLGVYLQVGDLNRQLGNADAAVRVHQDVLNRHNISQDITMMAHERLAKDYEALGQYEKAEKHAEAMLKEDKKNLWALQALHRLAVKSKKWNSAIKAFQKENASGGSADPLLPAIYKTQEAIDVKNAGNIAEAITLLKQASKLNNKCAAPYYHLGKIKQEENNYKHAIDFFTTFVELDPTAGSYVFSEIEKMYFELGQFEQVEQFYQRLHKKQPENLEVVIGLAAYFERKGEYRDALSLLEDVKDPDFTNLSYILKRLNILEKLGHKDALKQAVDEFVSSDRRSRILTCPECGNVSDEPSYICGKCGWVELA